MAVEPTSPGLSRRVLLVGLAALPAAFGKPARAALFPPDGVWDFAVLDADGGRLGAQSFRFERRVDRFTVAIEVAYDLPASSPPLTVRHRSRETWRDGWLYAIESRSRFGPLHHRLQAARDEVALRGRRDGHAFSVSGYVVPSSLWHPETPRLKALLDSVSGRLRVIRGRRGPRVRVPHGAGRVEATYWLVEGELSRELWYDAEGHLVRARFAAPDGTPLVLERRDDRA